MILDQKGYFYRETLSDGQRVAICPLTYGRARLTIGGDSNFYKHGY